MRQHPWPLGDRPFPIRRPAGRSSPEDRSGPSERIDTGIEEIGHTNPMGQRGTLAEASECHHPSPRWRVGLVWAGAVRWEFVSFEESKPLRSCLRERRNYRVNLNELRNFRAEAPQTAACEPATDRV